MRDGAKLCSNFLLQATFFLLHTVIGSIVNIKIWIGAALKENENVSAFPYLSN